MEQVERKTNAVNT